MNEDNMDNVRRKISKTIRIKEKEYLKGKINELENKQKE
jgi:hypothetical protein